MDYIDMSCRVADQRAHTAGAGRVGMRLREADENVGIVSADRIAGDADRELDLDR